MNTHNEPKMCFIQHGHYIASHPMFYTFYSDHHSRANTTAHSSEYSLTSFRISCYNLRLSKSIPSTHNTIQYNPTFFQWNRNAAAWNYGNRVRRPSTQLVVSWQRIPNSLTESHMKSSMHSLIPFLPFHNHLRLPTLSILCCNCQLRESTQF
jgi:hypothetical protein